MDKFKETDEVVLQFELVSDFFHNSLPSDVPIMVHKSSALTYCAVEQGLFPACRPVAGVIGQRPSCLELQGHPGESHHMGSVALWTAPQQSNCVLSAAPRCPKGRLACTGVSAPQDQCLCIPDQSLASCLTDGGVSRGQSAGDSSTACASFVSQTHGQRKAPLETDCPTLPLGCGS